MSEEPTKPTPPSAAAKRAGRRTRFALPPDHHAPPEADRTAERIEAFLEGPAPAKRTRRGRVTGAVRPRNIVPLDTRTDWERAMRLEDARIARYARPASVMVVEVAVPRDGNVDPLVQRVGLVVRRQARETDRVARIGPTRFHVLLPETDADEATMLAGRVEHACRDVVPAVSPGDPDRAGPPDRPVRVAVASASGATTLADALALAQARLET